jgi:hypothetical protein
MIQRIQTIWFFLAAVAIALLLMTPIVSKVINDSEYWITSIGLYQQTNAKTAIDVFIPVAVLTILASVLLLFTIFSYSDRKRQKMFAFSSLVIILVLSVLTYIYLADIPGGLEGVTYKLGAFLPLISIIFIGLGVRGINNDEKLIKSADRLR